MNSDVSNGDVPLDAIFNSNQSIQYEGNEQYEDAVLGREWIQDNTVHISEEYSESVEDGGDREQSYEYDDYAHEDRLNSEEHGKDYDEDYNYEH